MRRTSMTIPAALSLTALLAACGGDDSATPAGDGRLTVAVSFYPVEEVVRQVGGDLVDVVTVVPPGEEAHEYEPTAKQLSGLAEADVVVYLGNDFQPGVEKALESLPADVVRVDLLDSVELQPIGEELGHEEGDTHTEEEGDAHAEEEGDDHGHEGDDPHVWLDPANMATMAATVADQLGALRAEDAEAFTAGAARYAADLQSLDDELTSGLAACESTVLVTGHHAFGYLATAYGLTQAAISGISPSEEPSAEALAEVAAFAADNGVTTIFFEENLPPDLSRTVADEIGATTAVLDTVESPSKEQLDGGATYISIMRENLESLRTGLRCA